MIRVFLLCFILVFGVSGPAAAATASANLTVTVTQSSPSLPPAAVAAGFTTVALNADFSVGNIDLGCWPGQDNEAHTWYQGIWYAGGWTAPCDAIQNVVDPGTGRKALDITWRPSYAATYGATMITTINQAHNRVTDFPNGYYESTFRVQTTPNVVGLGGTWWNTWMWGSTQAQQGSSVPVVEYDIMESHGEFPTYLTSGCINWGTGGPGHAGCNFTYESFRSGFDYRQVHTYGYRITSDGTNGSACGYLDNVFQGCAAVTLTGAENIQRNFLMASIGYGCNFTNGYGNCVNEPLASVFSCPSPYSGKICFTIPSSDCCGTSLAYPTNNPLAYISEIQGVPNANGVWNVTAVDPWPGSQQTWVLLGSTFSGTWVPGTGYFNKFERLDMYLYSFRVLSCASWATTMCNGPVLSGPP